MARKDKVKARKINRKSLVVRVNCKSLRKTTMKASNIADVIFSDLWIFPTGDYLTSSSGR